MVAIKDYMFIIRINMQVIQGGVFLSLTNTSYTVERNTQTQSASASTRPLNTIFCTLNGMQQQDCGLTHILPYTILYTTVLHTHDNDPLHIFHSFG